MMSWLPFLRELSRVARTLTMGAAIPSAENKGGAAGFDPVTELDRSVELALRSAIGSRFPDHAIAGEEFGISGGPSRWCWSLDPIDGTRALICGLPSWTTLVALLDDGEPAASMIDVPALDELVLGCSDGAEMVGRAGEQALKVSGCAELAQARLSTTDPFLFEGTDAAAFDRLRQAAKVTRFGLDALAYARLAAGAIDLVAETGLKPHDYHALVPVVRGAGGVIGNWRGGMDLSGGDVLAAATPTLFEQAVERLGSADA